MSPFDDNDLIEGLQSGIAQRQSGVSAPEAIGDYARRAAHRRTASRALVGSVPVLAAAGVATVLATSSGAGSTSTGGVHVGGSGASAQVAPAMSGGPVQAQDMAYIIKRVRANLADAAQNGTLVHSIEYGRGTANADGSLTNLRWEIADTYDYIAPDGSEASFETMHNEDGSTYLTMSDDDTAPVNGKVDDDQIDVNPHRQTYSRNEYKGIHDPHASDASPSVYSSPSAVQQALQNGQVTKTGTATIDGTQAIALSVKLPAAYDEGLTLYVDSQSYQPMRTVMTLDGHPDLFVSNWLPATSAAIAQAEDNRIPPGYTEVAKTDLYR